MMFFVLKVIQLERDLELNLFKYFLCCCTLSQEYMWNGLGLKRALKAASSGDRTEGQGWASRAVDQRKLAA